MLETEETAAPALVELESRALKVARVCDVEVFTAPDGVEYVRTSDPAAAVAFVCFPWTSLRLYLRPRSAESIRKAVERKERRLERRVARLRRPKTPQPPSGEEDAQAAG